MAGLLTKGVTLAMVDYASSPTFAVGDVVANLQEFPDLLGEFGGSEYFPKGGHG